MHVKAPSNDKGPSFNCMNTYLEMSCVYKLGTRVNEPVKLFAVPVSVNGAGLFGSPVATPVMDGPKELCNDHVISEPIVTIN